MANKLYDENSVKAVADAIRAKNGSTEKYKLANMPQAIESIGKGNYWDYILSFKISEDAPIETLDIKLPKYCISLNNAFSGNYYTRPKYKTIIISKPDEVEYPVTQMNNLLYYNTTTEEIYLNIDTSKVTIFGIGHYNYSKLYHIYGVFDCSGATTGMSFDGNYIKTITFKEGTIHQNIYMAHAGVLYDESIQSIIDGLAQVTEARTITLHTNVKAKLTEEQIAVINEKGWTLA